MMIFRLHFSVFFFVFDKIIYSTLDYNSTGRTYHWTMDWQTYFYFGVQKKFNAWLKMPSMEPSLNEKPSNNRLLLDLNVHICQALPFSLHQPLGKFSQQVAMSVCLSVCLWSVCLSFVFLSSVCLSSVCLSSVCLSSVVPSRSSGSKASRGFNIITVLSNIAWKVGHARQVTSDIWNVTGGRWHKR